MTVAEREKLFNEVWEEPVITVAKKYGLSDNGLRKRCLAADIPLPPSGYWAKLKAGKPVPPKPKLPQLNSGSRKNVTGYAITFEREVKELSDEELCTDQPLFLYSQKSKELITSTCNSVKVEGQLRNPHPLIVEHIQQIEYREIMKKKNPNYLNSPYWFRNISTKSVIDIRVSKELSNRAYRIIDTFIKTIEPLEGSVNITPCSDRDCCNIHIPDYWTETTLYEETVDERIKGRRSYNTKYTGRLSIKFVSQLYKDNTLIFTDESDNSLEKQIGNIIFTLFNDACRSKMKHEQWSRKWDREQKEKEIQRQLKEKQDEENSRLKKVVEKANNFQIAKNLRELAKAINAKSDNIQDDSSYVQWILDKADYLDPTICKKDEILGYKYSVKSNEDEE